MDLTIAVEPRDRETTLRVTGDLDVDTTTHLAQAIEACIAGREHHICQLDLSQVDFVDSSGLSALIDAKRTLDRGEHELRLTTNERIDRVLDVAGLASFFGRDRDDANPPLPTG